MKTIFRSFLAILLLAVCFPLAAIAELTGLSNANESFTLVLSGAAATTNPTYNITTSGRGGALTFVGSTTGATAVAPVTGPSTAGTPVMITGLSIYNADTAAVTVTAKKVVSGTGYTLFKQSIPVGSTLMWNETSGLVFSGATAVANIGAASGTGVTASEQGNGVVQKTVLSLSAAEITMRDTEQGGGLKIYDFPEGRIQILGVVGTMRMATTSVIASTLNSGVTCQWSVGTVTQANTTLATTEQDLIPVTAWTSGTTISVLNTATSAALAATAQFDGTTTAKDAYLNLAVAGATDIDANATVACTGTVTITWTWLGDY